MSTPRKTARPRVLLAGALAQIERRLLDLPERETLERTVVPDGPRPVVAVVGLRPGCGASTVAQALAVELAGNDTAKAAAVCRGAVVRAPVPRSAAAARLARTLAGVAPGRTRAAGRVCLVDSTHHLAVTAAAMDIVPLVLDVPHEPGGPLSLADHVVLVAPPAAEPALVAVVAASLAREGPEPLCVVNRVREPDRWSGRPVIVLEESRLGARLAAMGQAVRGTLGPGMEELAASCGQAACA